MFADIVSRAFAKSTVERRPELNLVHVNLIKTNSTQSLSSFRHNVACSCQSYHRGWDCAENTYNCYSRRLEAAYLQCQCV